MTEEEKIWRVAHKLMGIKESCSNCDHSWVKQDFEGTIVRGCATNMGRYHVCEHYVLKGHYGRTPENP